jgi:hypothetical protein
MINVNSNSEIYQEDGGQFQIYLAINLHKLDRNITQTLHNAAKLKESFVGNLFSGYSGCIRTDQPASSIEEDIKKMELTSPHFQSSVLISSYFQVEVSVSYQNFNSSYHISLSKLKRTIPDEDDVFVVEISASTSNCSVLRSVGYWNDPLQWEGSLVPSSSGATVIFPKSTGVVSPLFINDKNSIFLPYYYIYYLFFFKMI